jgi:hypothetical protein
MTRFDLSGVSQLQYKNKLRLTRVAAIAVAAMIGSALVYRALFVGPDPALLIGYLFAAGAVCVGIWVALFYAVPGPTELDIHGASLRFRFRSGRVLSLDIQNVRFHLRLAEAVPPTHPPRGGRIVEDAPCFAVVGVRWLPLTRDSYAEVLRVLRELGVPEKSSVRPNPPVGGFRISDFSRSRA